MINLEKERIEAKLKLWDTPGFNQFLNDFATYLDLFDLPLGAQVLKRSYLGRLEEIKEAESKFKQGKLDL